MLTLIDDRDLARTLRADVLAGLTVTPKWLPPRWFYDARGSELFEEITRLPEYYPTRAERAVLAGHAPAIARITEAKCLVELGSGSSEKTRLLLDAMLRRGTLGSFVPLDVSAGALTAAVGALTAAYPGLTVTGVVGDFARHLAYLPEGDSRVVAFLGGTIGNLTPPERVAFLTALRGALHEGEWLLLGADLVKDPAVLVPAYDDAAGVTAEFNRNVLRVINRELGADFDPAAFEHVALWDAGHEWIEMRLRSSRDQVVRIPELDLTVPFAAGEEMRTEISAKFRRDGLAAELAAAGFTLRHWWTDPDDRFGVALAQAG
ncbi:histidine N-alpha-methyltransferase [Actinoplanes lobatus]|uniref:Histidine N-alpha-methyltransferase n=1 Tax=Actinoplanes lobatus TaxID=113568 RepID=A0A7W7H8I0_9ACTN|nr:L-histidine N(alpha)-methyltransferase [Actinoplanes lobatus]MBB4745886.1 L-histidine N-alpha-methyltransferase [Actinoplanes lobatus]GGN89220.1 histidine N-alpha-methyltransferase [Actinoplanes lobatus]GIE43625.1 histidine N-alpha-methyltransferase [Actinoplanes lobatus]